MNQGDNKPVRIDDGHGLPWGGKDVSFFLFVFLVAIVLPGSLIGVLPYPQTITRFVVTAIFPIPVLLLIFIWRKRRNIDLERIGLCLPKSELFSVTLVAVLLAAIVKGVDYSLFFGSLTQLNWSKFSIIPALLYPFSIGLGIVIISPIEEELIFRGILYGYLRSKFGWSTAIVFQSLTFASVHPQIYQEGIGVFFVYHRFSR